jgi:single-strand DNA-binding protein
MQAMGSRTASAPSDPSADPTFNRAELIGFVGRAPEIRFTVQQEPVARFSLATRHWKDEGTSSVEITDWHHLVAFGKPAEACKRLRPGDLVHVRGRLRTHSWSDDSRTRHVRTEIVVDEIHPARNRARQARLPL